LSALSRSSAAWLVFGSGSPARRKVVLPAGAIERIDLNDRNVAVRLTKVQIHPVTLQAKMLRLDPEREGRN
jgi:hypothetical protein